jgi:hypothetical protein
MVRSKSIPVVFAAFCGVAFQFQASAAIAYNPLMPVKAYSWGRLCEPTAAICFFSSKMAILSYIVQVIPLFGQQIPMAAEHQLP